MGLDEPLLAVPGPRKAYVYPLMMPAQATV